MTKEGVNKWWNELVALKNGETIETRVKYVRALPGHVVQRGTLRRRSGNVADDRKEITTEIPERSKWSDWKSDSSPEFSSTHNREHRIKPKPRECWIVKMNGCSIESSTLYNTLEGAEAYRNRNLDSGFGQLEIIHMVEAL